jgi:hypothetical protein
MGPGVFCPKTRQRRLLVLNKTRVNPSRSYHKYHQLNQREERAKHYEIIYLKALQAKKNGRNIPIYWAMLILPFPVESPHYLIINLN